MKIVDCHAHIWDEGWQPAPYKRSIARSAANRRHPPQDPESLMAKVMAGSTDPTGAITVSDMDEAGVATSVLVMVDTGLGCGEEADTPPTEVARAHAAAVRQNPGRLEFLFGMDPRRQGVSEQFEQAVRDGAKGLKLYPPSGFYPHDAAPMDLARLAAEHGLPTMCHAGESTPPLQSRFARPVDVGDLAALVPDATIVMAHLGRDAWWKEALAVTTRCSNIVLDLSGWWQALLKHGDAVMITALRHILNEVGAHRVMWGTDRSSGPRARQGLAPQVTYWLELADRARSHGISFSDEEIEFMLGRTAEQVFALA